LAMPQAAITPKQLRFVDEYAIDLYRPRFLGHRIEPYAASAAG
jgi:hypothetical protein